ncbi:Cation calcium exchanger [Quillaja saponaria]|uniref:Cation calcium exchanger n=1 Tax=Quillaja saponaria TaxID=32244 RepID=A0AAD7Q7R7_QUISA|nr:Cation calcium exchanger [Quillaja saponaria]
MAVFTSISQPKKLSVFLNISFLIFISLFIKTNLYPSINSDNFPDHYSNDLSTPIINHSQFLEGHTLLDDCNNLDKYSDYMSKCLYVKSHVSCRPNGYINYLQVFYCNVGQSPFLGYFLLVLWLFVLFYLLGNTASNYFCSCLENLSKIMKLSPTLAGVTLLSLGNGAPDVFASVVSFTSTRKNGDLGLNEILGGVFFVSSIVIGIISILVSPNQIEVDKASFIRDVLFLIFSLCSLLLIIFIGKINLWGSICFVSIYFIYVCTVSATHFIYRSESKMKENQFAVSPASTSLVHSQEDLAEMGIPLLGYVDDEKVPIILAEKVGFEDKDQKPRISINSNSLKYYCNYWDKFLHILELPLYLPRRLTIPVVSEERWSKPYAVVSVTLAPILLAALFDSRKENMGSRSRLVTCMTAGLIGMVLGNIAYVTTNKCSPPRKCLFLWLIGGFVMTVTWTYIIAQELVSLLVSLGSIIGVSPSTLGLTVLAWGNSLGDFIANSAMAMNGGKDGVQIAIAGCYAGPLFNTLIGLGLPLVLSAWSEYPNWYLIPEDSSLYETLGFLIGGLLWALVVLPKKNMRLDRSLGIGLLSIYICFLFLKMAKAFGLVNL